MQYSRGKWKIIISSSYPLSILVVGIGHGPWEDKKKFDEKIPAQDFDNFLVD